MRAAVRRQYGAPDVVALEEIEKPSPGDGEVLVRVHAVSLNASDWEFLTGTPAYVRMWGLFRPKYEVLGSDIAGRVEAVGKKVEKFRPGDEVFGDIIGKYDLILDLVARRSVFDNKRALSPKGRYVVAGGSLPRILEVLFLGPLLSMGGRKMGLLAARANKGLAHMVDLFEAGTVVPVIDRTYALSEAAEALRYLGEGRALGKVVIAVGA